MKWVLRIVGGLVALVLLATCVLFLFSRRPGAGDTHIVVEIAQPPAVVWTWITEPAKVKQWVSWLAEIREETPNTKGVGAREVWIMDDPNMKQRMEIPSTVTAYDPPRLVKVHIAAKGMFDGDATYTLTPTATGTRLVQDGVWDYHDAFARLMVPLITPQANKKGLADFTKLKTLAEAK